MTCIRSLVVLYACTLSLIASAESRPEPLPYYGDLSVIAHGIREADPNAPPSVLEAYVYINGTPVGRTPYWDGLPAGKYSVEVRYGDDSTSRYIVDVTPGKSYAIEAKLTVPMTPEERAQRKEKAEAELRALREKAYDAYREAAEAWDAKWKPLVPKRKRMRTLGGVLLGTGLSALIPGAALVVSASKDDDTVQSLYAGWLQSVDTESREHYAALIADKQSTRDHKNISGIILLATGGAMSVAGTVLLPLSPNIPEKPEPNGYMLSTLRISPWASPNAGGLSLHLRF